ncbi:hypothetical protein LZ30DRAFT_663908 [Colletotrichum cereale]|nr:hypothetical protein LZ30DRAFT_663908 [Colletotrichum cereale]
MGSNLPKQAATMADLDQTEICQLKEALAEAQVKITRLLERQEQDQTEIMRLQELREQSEKNQIMIAHLQARIDELREFIEHLLAENDRAREESSHGGGGVQQELQTNGFLYLENVHFGEDSDPVSPIGDEGLGTDLNMLDTDDAATKYSQLSSSDSGFEGDDSDW